MLLFFTPTPRMMENAIAAVSQEKLTWTPSHLFLYVHGGLDEIQDADAVDETLPRPAREYLQEAFERDWIRPRPAADRPPRVLVMSGVNPLRRWPVPQVVEKVLWPKLRMLAAVDFRLSTTRMKSDLLLPAAGYYEKRGIKYAVALAPYVVVGDQAMAPLGESKSEWEIMSLLARSIQQRARERGIEGELASMYDVFSMDGAYGPEDDVKVIDTILRNSPITGGVGWEEALEAGAVPVATAGPWGLTSGIGSDIEQGGTLSPSRIHVDEKHAWPTLTGRQQFYLDHDWFFEGDEVLPRWKPLPRPGGDHPILLSSGHERWSIHAIWRGHRDLLRLQRGGPCMWMSVEDARARGIADGDMVRVRNDHGEFRVNAKVAPVMAPGEALIYHAWEPYQFPGWKGNMEVVSSPYKPLHFAGGYGHLRYRIFFAGPIHVPRGIPIEIELDQPG
jgi:anaerobic selenocysteine-containing dehydrogenase